VARFREGAVVQLVGNGPQHSAACSRIFNGTSKQYHKEDRPWVVMGVYGDDKGVVPCGKWGFLISPLAHDPTKHGGHESVELDPGALPPGIYDSAKGRHFLVHTVCSVVAQSEMRHHTFGPKRRPVSLATNQNEYFWAEAMLEHHARWPREALLGVYTCWCQEVLGINGR
jgi:hypothetical protein